MMNISEYLFTKLGEESAEIIQMASKINIFGLEEVYAKAGGKTNKERLVAELNDLFATVELLQRENLLPLNTYDPEAVKDKKAKLIKYMEYSKSIGTLSEMPKV